jgi:putative pyrimidine permease RutG
VYTLIGVVVMKIGTRWIERLMPPVVTGAVVMAIGLNLAPSPYTASPPPPSMAGWRC